MGVIAGKDVGAGVQLIPIGVDADAFNLLDCGVSIDSVAGILGEENAAAAATAASARSFTSSSTARRLRRCGVSAGKARDEDA